MRKILHHPHFIPWVLFLFFTTLYFASTVGGMNSFDGPQFALTKALMEKNTIKINNFMQYVYTDYASFANNLYSKRAPGESILAIPFYTGAKFVQQFSKLPYNGNHEGLLEESKIEALTVAFNATFGAGIIVVIYFFCLSLTQSRIISLVTAATTGTGTLLWRYSSTFQRFPISGFFLITSLYAFHQLNIKKKSKYHIYLFGLSTGLLYFIDPSFLFVITVIASFFIVQVSRRKIISSRRSFIAMFFLFITPIVIVLFYNYSAFHNPFTNSYLFDAEKTYWRNPKNYFLTSLYPSVLVNLFNRDPIPPSTFSPKVLGDQSFSEQESIYWSLKNDYKGIFTQSPYLLPAIIGLIVLMYYKSVTAILLLVVSVIYYIQVSMYTSFFGANSYDTHYFLPIIPLLTVGFGKYLQTIKKYPTVFLLRLTCYFVITISIAISIYNGWYSNLTNFAPHVSGEHRFSFNQLVKPYFTRENLKENSWLLFINTFPNIYNVPILLIFYLFPFVFIYFLHQYYSSLFKHDWSKNRFSRYKTK